MNQYYLFAGEYYGGQQPRAGTKQSTRDKGVTLGEKDNKKIEDGIIPGQKFAVRCNVEQLSFSILS